MPERLLAVVTGASSGIGAEFARQLAARGYDLLLVARREDRLSALAPELAAAHSIAAEIMVADLAQDRDRQRLANRIAAASNLGLLVNNAGFGTVGFFQNAGLEDEDRMHRLHVLTPLALSHAALKNFAACGGALRNVGIINVSSVAGFQQAPSNISYCATKAWLTSFTTGLAIELAAQQSPVRVQALCPGFTYSEFHDRLGIDRGPIPKSMWMTAEFVVFESLRALDRGSLIVIPGWRYRLLVTLMKITPDFLMRRLSIAAQRRYRKPKAKL